MSLKKLNMNSMKVAKPIGKDALSLLSELAKKYENNVEFTPKVLVDSNIITNFDEETNDDRDEIIDIEVSSEFKNVNDTAMATIPTKEEIKELGFETSIVYMCLKLEKKDAEIMDRLSITSNRLNKHYNKLSELGYIERSITLLKRDSDLNMPQNASSEVLESKQETIEQNKETDMTPACLIQDNVSPIEISDEHFMTIPTKAVGKTQDEILFDLNQKIYMDSHAKQNKKGEVFNYENSDRASLAEMEQYPPKHKKNNFICTI